MDKRAYFYLMRNSWLIKQARPIVPAGAIIKSYMPKMTGFFSRVTPKPVKDAIGWWFAGKPVNFKSVQNKVVDGKTYVDAAQAQSMVNAARAKLIGQGMLTSTATFAAPRLIDTVYNYYKEKQKGKKRPLTQVTRVEPNSYKQ